MVLGKGKAHTFDFDLIVVGAGPVGCEVGRLVARKGFKVAIFEEHADIGRPIQCGGLVSGKVLGMTGYKDVVNSLRGADIYSPSGTMISFMAPDARAYVLDRERFDKYMAAKAGEAGCKVVTGTKVSGVSELEDGLEVRTEAGDGSGTSGTYRCRIIVGADGVQGCVAKWLKLARPAEIVSGYEVMYDGLSIDPEKALVVSGKTFAPGFFGWAIPHGPTRALVGLGVCEAPRPAKDYFEEMVVRPPMRDLLKGGSRKEAFAGCIPLGITGRTYTDRAMVVGDAAAQVKSLSGGGLYTGLMAAKHCGRVATKALESGDCTKRVLKEYQELWEHSIGHELKNGSMLRKFYINLSDEQIDQLVEIINGKDLLPLITAYGDIDSPSILAKVMLKRAPSLLKFTGPLLRALF
jgi:geranylgeranyl reductase family protein